MSWIYQYILEYTIIHTPLQDFEEDIVMPLCWMQEPEEGDPSPCPEDEEFFVRPDAAGMEEAIDKFLNGLECQERRGFKETHRFLSTLLVPTPQESKGMTHAEALHGKFLPDLDEEQRKRFTQAELIMYRHAQEFRYITLYSSISQYTYIYWYIL